MKNAVADGLLKKIGNALVIGTLYILREVLPQLSTLSNTFQTGNLNFSRAGPNTEKKKKKKWSYSYLVTRHSKNCY